MGWSCVCCRTLSSTHLSSHLPTSLRRYLTLTVSNRTRTLSSTLAGTSTISIAFFLPPLDPCTSHLDLTQVRVVASRALDAVRWNDPDAFHAIVNEVIPIIYPLRSVFFFLRTTSPPTIFPPPRPLSSCYTTRSSQLNSRYSLVSQLSPADKMLLEKRLGDKPEVPSPAANHQNRVCICVLIGDSRNLLSAVRC